MGRRRGCLHLCELVVGIALVAGTIMLPSCEVRLSTSPAAAAPGCRLSSRNDAPPKATLSAPRLELRGGEAPGTPTDSAQVRPVRGCRARSTRGERSAGAGFSPRRLRSATAARKSSETASKARKNEGDAADNHTASRGEYVTGLLKKRLGAAQTSETEEESSGWSIASGEGDEKKVDSGTGREGADEKQKQNKRRNGKREFSEPVSQGTDSSECRKIDDWLEKGESAAERVDSSSHVAAVRADGDFAFDGGEGSDGEEEQGARWRSAARLKWGRRFAAASGETYGEHWKSGKEGGGWGLGGRWGGGLNWYA